MTDDAGIGKAGGLRHRLIVTPVKRARQAFAIQDRVLDEVGRNPAVGIDIREIQLTARLQQPVRGAEHGRLVGAEIDHAV